MGQLSHFDERGASRMVDVSHKEPTLRQATASALVEMLPETLALIQNKAHAKGDVLEVARLAGIQAAKRTWELIPLCHMLALEHVSLRLECRPPNQVWIEATVRLTGRTGVEMESLVAVSVAALTVYDMCKAVDRQIVIGQIQLEQKSGGQSGEFRRTHSGG